MRTWDRYHADVLPEAIGCPIPTVERALMRAAQEFCEKTGLWWRDLDAVNTTATNVMDFNLPRGALLARVVDATLSGRPLGLETPNGTSAADRQAGNSGGRRLLTTDMQTFAIMPTQAVGLPVIVTAWLKPSDDADGVQNHIGDNWSEALAAGALGRILAMSKSEWENQGRAGVKRMEFDAAIARAKLAAWKGFTKTRPRSIPQFF